MKNLLFLQNMGVTEWILILCIILLLFGGKKIPELMRGLGRGVREFNDAKNNIRSEVEKGMNESKSSETPDKN